MKADFAKLADMYAPLVARIYAGTDTDGDAAADLRSKLLASLLHRKSDDSFKPRDFSAPPFAVAELLRGVGEEDIGRVVEKANVSTLRQLCEHRETVTWIEAVNAQRLHVLAVAYLKCVADPKDLGMADEFRKYIAEWWSVTIPNAVDLRSWCVKATRSYKALPRHWRTVDMPVIKAAKEDEGGHGHR